MSVRTGDNRLSMRGSSAHFAVVRDTRGKVLANGRTANISEKGVFVVARLAGPAVKGQQVVVQMTLPNAAVKRGKRRLTRTVTYRCRVTRIEEMGDLTGLGAEFIEKVE